VIGIAGKSLLKTCNWKGAPPEPKFFVYPGYKHATPLESSNPLLLAPSEHPVYRKRLAFAGSGVASFFKSDSQIGIEH